jgi:glycolate oxidase iron-sulfur subunit
VRYGRLVDIGRGIVEKKVGRDLAARTMRYTLRRVLPNSGIFSSLLKLGQSARPLLGLMPARLRDALPPAQAARFAASHPSVWPPARHARKMLVLEGCVQPALAPNINAATARVLDRLGISIIKATNAGCCGAVSYHLNAQEEGLDYMRRNVDAWWPYVASGSGAGVARGTKGVEGAENFDSAEAVVITASGCGVTVKEYGHLLRHDPAYAQKAMVISEMARDISEVIDAEIQTLQPLLDRASNSTNSTGTHHEMPKLAFHSPCTLQHGMKIRGTVEKILLAAGFELTYVPDAHLCCGSAGTYSILQPELSQQLLANKVAALESGAPARIATANIGCLMHVRGGTSLPVDHWIEILDEKLRQDDEQSHAELVPDRAALSLNK